MSYSSSSKLSTTMKQSRTRDGRQEHERCKTVEGARENPLLAADQSAGRQLRVNEDLKMKREHLPSLCLACIFLVSLLACLLCPSSVQAIRLQPEGREKFYWSGEQFVITCQNNNNIKNVKIRWIGPNGSDITEDRSQRVHAESTGPHGHRLVVMNATASVDDGQYKCTLGSTDDRYPREHIEFNLKIHKITNFRDTERHLVLPTGRSGTLTCRVEFDPNVSSASISWVKDHRPIEMFNDTSYTIVDYDPSRQMSQLIISPLTKQHDGVYTCRAFAETAHLSKITDFNIELETNYAPHFEEESQVVWVERGRASNDLYRGGSGLQHGQPNIYGHPTGTRSRARLNKQQSVGRRTQESYSQESTLDSPQQTNGSIVRVELRCTCQANPLASILWTSTQNSMFVLVKGEPTHVLEEPRVEIEGHNTTSILTIGYNLDPEWTFRRDSYICSAQNKLGKATKTFTIEQGDPPPAFNVGPLKHYSPETSLFKLTILGPNYDPEGQQQLPQQPQAEIVPPVDFLRIRAELSSGSSAGSSSNQAGQPVDHKMSSSLRRHQRLNDPSVQWSLDSQQQQQLQQQMPQNHSISLAKLPSGNQKLYLEAHNAVGWSPNATYLGDFYIISAATSISCTSSFLVYLLTISLLFYFDPNSNRPHIC